jgi:hypothetical protein
MHTMAPMWFNGLKRGIYLNNIYKFYFCFTEACFFCNGPINQLLFGEIIAAYCENLFKKLTYKVSEKRRFPYPYDRRYQYALRNPLSM